MRYLRVLGGKFLQLLTRWEFGPAGSEKGIEEIALIGAGEVGQVSF